MDDLDPSHDLYATVMAAAGRLAGLSGEVRTVYVVAGRRPTYAELRAIRRDAEQLGLLVSVSADGSLAMRRRAPATGAHPPSRPRRPWVDARIAAELRRVVDGLRAWEAGFAGIREGTR